MNPFRAVKTQADEEFAKFLAEQAARDAQRNAEMAARFAAMTPEELAAWKADQTAQAALVAATTENPNIWN